MDQPSPDPLRFDLSTLEGTRRLAAVILAEAGPGALILLGGPLGAGKTTLTRLLAEALGSEADVTSPTYTLVHEYPTAEGPLIHIDAYRLPDPRALIGLGLEEYLERGRLIVVEWGEDLRRDFPEALLVRLHLSGGRRWAELEPGPKSS